MNAPDTWSAMVGARAGTSVCAVVNPDGSSWSLDELLARGAGGADWLDARGAQPGRPVPAFVHTTPASFALVFAGAGSARPLAPLSARFTIPELTECVRGLEPSLIVAAPDTRRVAEEVGAQTGHAVFVVPDEFPASRRELDMDPGADAVVAVIHTSGTTGRPKPVYQQQRPLALRVGYSAGPIDLELGSRYASASSFHHQAGAGLFLVAMGAGATLLPFPSFSPDSWRELAHLGPTHATVVPALMETLLDAGVLELPTLEWIQYGSSPLHPDTARRVLTEFPRLRLVQQFGQTEGSPITTLDHHDHVEALEHAPGRLRSVGRPIAGTELRIEGADEFGVGEICSRSAHYFAPDPDGWLRTSDLGYQDDDGFVYIVGRHHDVINRGGDKVYPVEVERVIATHPGVREVAVVGVADRRLGMVPHAFFVPTDVNSPPSSADLFDHTRAWLAGFKVPRDWHVVSELPRNPSGKLLRRMLVADERGGVDPTSGNEPR